MTLSYFPDVLPYYFFQNVKFCSRKIPLLLYVRLCHVLHDSRSGPRFNNKTASFQKEAMRTQVALYFFYEVKFV